MMEFGAWVKCFPAAIVVCDTEGTILEMNDRACVHFSADGGAELVGKSIYDCHPEHTRRKVQAMLAARMTNCYTVEKKGAKKLIYQAPWYSDEDYKGFVEIIFDIPTELPNFIR